MARKKKIEAPEIDPVEVEPATAAEPAVETKGDAPAADTLTEADAYAQANLTAAENNVKPYNGIDDWRQRTGGLKGAK